MINKRLILGLLFLATERAVQIISALYVNGVIARELSLAQFGMWQYAFSVSSILMALSWIGGAEAVVPTLTKMNQKEKLTFCNLIFFSRLVISFLAFLSAIVFALYCDEPLVRYFILGYSIAILLREPFMTGFSKWQSEGKLYYASIIQIVGCGIRVVILHLISNRDYFDSYLFIPWLVESLFVAISIYAIAIQRIPKIVFNLNKIYEIRSFILRGIYVWIGVISYSIFIKIDRLLLANRIDKDVFSLYAASSQINENLLSVCVIFIQVSAPLFLYGHLVKKVFIRNFSIIILFIPTILLIVSFIINFYSKDILVLIFGGKYVFSAEYLKTLIFIVPLTSVDNIINAANLRTTTSYFYIMKWSMTFLMFFFSICIIRFILECDYIYSVVFSLYISIFFGIIISTYWFYKKTLRGFSH